MPTSRIQLLRLSSARGSLNGTFCTWRYCDVAWHAIFLILFPPVAYFLYCWLEVELRVVFSLKYGARFPSSFIKGLSSTLSWTIQMIVWLEIETFLPNVDLKDTFPELNLFLCVMTTHEFKPNSYYDRVGFGWNFSTQLCQPSFNHLNKIIQKDNE